MNILDPILSHIVSTIFTSHLPKSLVSTNKKAIKNLKAEVEVQEGVRDEVMMAKVQVGNSQHSYSYSLLTKRSRR